jgi:alpha-amylase
MVWHSSPTGYYYGIFESFMPDLNYANPEVTREMEDVTRFWLEDISVDGFRLDAAKYLIENKHLQENTNATHDWFKQFRDYYKKINPNAVTIGELFGNNPTVINSYTKGDQLDLAFNFDLATAFIQSAKLGSAYPALNALNSTNSILESSQYSPFLTNHDQNRAMSELEGDQDKAKVAASLLLMAPGMPFIYYGEEIGMEGMKPDENIRRPMQWSSDQNGGFSTGAPWRQPDSKYKSINVEAETGDSSSLLSHYRNLIQLRNIHPALKSGDFTIVNSDNVFVFSSLRSSGKESVLILINTSSSPVSKYNLSLDKSNLPEGSMTISQLIGPSDTRVLKIDSSGGFADFKPVEELKPFETIILQLQK